MNTAEEITRDLERHMKESMLKIDNFLANQMDSLNRAQNAHETVMRDLESQVHTLRLEQMDFEEKHAMIENQHTISNQLIAAKKEELENMEKQKATLPAEVETAKAKELAAKQQLQNIQAEYEKREREVRYQLQELTKGIDFYKRLGLTFEKLSEDTLRVVFTLIDPVDPAKRFTFNVKTGASEAFIVEECEPAVQNLTDLVDELNRTEDFSKFVQLMRREFQKLVL